MNKQTNTIGIVIPAFNEEMMIGGVIRSLPASIDGHPTTIIVVNDGSHDNTGQVARKAGATVIDHLVNSGAGAATRTGIHFASQAGCSVVATIDADGQHRTEDLVAVVTAALADKADFIIGSRLKDAKSMVWHRRIGNIGLSFLTSVIFGAWVTDSQSGLKAFNAKAARVIDFRSNDYAFCSEMIWRAKQKHLRIAEVPIKAIYTDYSLGKGVQSSLNGPKIVARMIVQRFMGLING